MWKNRNIKQLRRETLTDDDVLEDVGVVVRCGCHLDSVEEVKNKLD